MDRHDRDELVDMTVSLDCCWEFITDFNFVLSNSPDESWTGGVFTADDRRTMLDFSYRHWHEHSPLLSRGAVAPGAGDREGVGPRRMGTTYTFTDDEMGTTYTFAHFMTASTTGLRSGRIQQIGESSEATARRALG